MDIQGFIKSILIDSLAGISLDNLPFILFQLLITSLSLFILARFSKTSSSTKRVYFHGILFTLIVIIASTSVPLALMASAIALSFIVKSDKELKNENFSIIFIAFCSGSGHIILLILGLAFLLVFSKFKIKNAK